ncbi:hypothetical protein [Hymenobacter psychrotolerans]|nr:hypothetical protein [Hymenobacter psychrotolerans]
MAATHTPTLVAGHVGPVAGDWLLSYQIVVQESKQLVDGSGGSG